jgi:membrane-bound ClpP family serine protease
MAERVIARARAIDVRTWKEEANAVRLSIYAALLSLAAQHGRGKSWAESFFKKKSAANERDDDDEPVDSGELPDEV